MNLTLDDIRRIAAEAAVEENVSADVVGATHAEGNPLYAEVILTLRGCRREPCRVVVGIRRDKAESECRHDARLQLRQHVAEHRADDVC